MALSLRDFVLVDALDLDLRRGFTSLTGETGAGKSILLDALRVALGSKAERRYVRDGSARASVSAVFAVPEFHDIRTEIAEAGFDIPTSEALVFRRVITADGPSRAFLNDQIVSAPLLESLGEKLVEIHGQHDGTALLRQSSHIDLLDRYAGAEPIIASVSERFAEWKAAATELQSLKDEAQQSSETRDFLHEAVEELDGLSPADGEAETLSAERSLLQNSQKLTECLEEAEKALKSSKAEHAYGVAARALERARRYPGMADDEVDGSLPKLIANAAEAVERTLIELSEAGFAVEQARAGLSHNGNALEAVENRLFTLRSTARKYGLNVEGLPAFLDDCRAKLDIFENFDDRLREAEANLLSSRAAYFEQAEKLRSLRQSSGTKLAQRVEAELKPLKLERTRFQVSITPLDDDKAGPRGADKIAFEVSTNPGTPFGPLNRIASGGELARFSLALNVCLAATNGASLMVFDEVDQGVGGAVAAAVGERLASLAEEKQVIAITHSPQVAASGHAHWHISKAPSKDGRMRSDVVILNDTERSEELARMLSGAEVTEEARAAANRLMAPAE